MKPPKDDSTASSNYRPTRFHPPRVRAEDREGVIHLSHPDPLAEHHRNLVSLLLSSAERFGDQPFLHERPGPGEPWRSVTYEVFAARAARAGAALAAEGVRPGDRVAILARNSIAYAIAAFGVMALGAVVVPLTPLYLAHPVGADLLRKLAGSAGVSLALLDADLLAGPAQALNLADRSIALQGLDETEAMPIDLTAAERSVQPGDLAKILFTSGSTGLPKATPNTHAMLTAATAMIDQIGAKPADGSADVMVDWLPWHHTYGGNVNIHATMQGGGRFYIDGGGPTPAGLPVTLSNIAEVGPTILTTVPAAFGPMLAMFRSDPALADAVFRNLSRMSFGGAALPSSIVDAYQDLAQGLVGSRIQFGSGYGMTETGGILALVHWPTERGDLLGLPLPGVEMKLVPQEDGRFECRVRGPNVFSGYLGHDEQPFDEEGYFITGDAVRAAEPGDWSQGLVFAGRVAEDFKLDNGVWVRAGALRAEALDRLGPLALDAVVVGASRSEVGLLVLAAPGADDHALRARLEGLYGDRPASRRIARVAALRSPPDARAGEMTAKGTLNAARVNAHRTDEIEALYADQTCCVG